MKRILLITFLILVNHYCFSQSSLSFEYDNAGNQIFRGNTRMMLEPPPLSTMPVPKPILIEDPNETKLWNNVTLYPVPVEDILTIQWNSSINHLIESVSLYQHSSINWIDHLTNNQQYNNRFYVDMRDYSPGVYIVSFRLTTGKTYTKTIIKE